MTLSNEEIALELVKLALKESQANSDRPAALYTDILKKVYSAQEKTEES